MGRLQQFPEACGGNGSLAALVAGPSIVMVSEYLPEVFGSETLETDQFET
jgi:hypothetical protein